MVEIDWDEGYGSGYFLKPGIILTAAHVIRPRNDGSSNSERHYRVRSAGRRGSAPPEWASATVEWDGVSEDVAVLRSNTFDPSHNLPRLARTSDGAAEIECKSIGFPLVTKGNVTDDTYQLDGVIRTATLIRGDDLSVDIKSSPPSEPDTWPGISGAALFTGHRLIGVVRSYPSNFGGRVLKATAISGLAENKEFCAAIGEPCPLPVDKLGDPKDSARLFLSHTLAALIVDLLRLLYALSDARSYAVNIGRFGKFISMAELHAGELREQILRSGSHIDPHDLDQVSRIERECQWVLSHIREYEDPMFDARRCFGVIHRTIESAYALISSYFPHTVALEESVVEEAFRRARANHGAEMYPWGVRLMIQQDLIEQRERELGIRTVAHDSSHMLSLLYFLVDRCILQSDVSPHF